jgi:phosphatidylserine/phosphatidylglycerophosphate/cardiolipin synthase-like enzyme
LIFTFPSLPHVTVIVSSAPSPVMIGYRDPSEPPELIAVTVAPAVPAHAQAASKTSANGRYRCLRSRERRLIESTLYPVGLRAKETRTAESAPVEVHELTDGGQTAEQVAEWIAAFIGEAQHTLELALYDIRLPDRPGDIVAGALRDASARGVQVRLLYNVDSSRPPAIHPPPSTRPEVLHELPISDRGVPGIPDLMHHKYVVRDGAAVWTGSMNWTIDSWTRQENVVVAIESEGLAAAYSANFEELWDRRDVERSGRVDPDPVDLGGGVTVRPWFTPGHGAALSQQIARAIACAQRRVRIASPVITSAPILSTLAELGGRGGVDIAGVVDEPQTDAVYGQWAANGVSAWKTPLLAKALSLLPFSGKPSTPWGPDTTHDYMHAKVTVADDTVFVGSFNLSRSGEMNAENVLEIHDPAFAEQMASFIDAVRARYPATSVPPQAMATISSTSSDSVGISRSSPEMRPGASSSVSTQSSSPDQ